MERWSLSLRTQLFVNARVPKQLLNTTCFVLLSLAIALAAGTFHELETRSPCHIAAAPVPTESRLAYDSTSLAPDEEFVASTFPHTGPLPPPTFLR